MMNNNTQILISDQEQLVFQPFSVNKKELMFSVAQRYQQINLLSYEIIFIDLKERKLIEPLTFASTLSKTKVLLPVERYQSFVFKLNNDINIRKEVDCSKTIAEVFYSIGFDGYCDAQDSNFDLSEYFITKYYSHKTPIMIKLSPLYLSSGFIPVDYFTQFFLVCKSILMSNIHAISVIPYTQMAVFNFLLSSNITINPLLNDISTIEHYLLLHSLEQLEQEQIKLYHSLGVQTKSFIPFHLQPFLTHKLLILLGKKIVNYSKFPKSYLIRCFVTALSECEGIKTIGIIGKHCKDRTLLSLGEDGVYITNCSGTLQKKIQLNRISKWKSEGKSFYIFEGNPETQFACIEFDTKQQATDTVRVFSEYTDKLAKQRNNDNQQRNNVGNDDQQRRDI
ncbi:hypothetical protein EHI8A_000430 [Entamoeba histolytica HM-1:IMSS-B]|uniref:Uncharacterized protein n=6 Tax=Entamoeba histolytica TaxID=5759 RepID=C4LYM2_ENTH1|nr:hypothetical protein EHI_118740 [Entamoeba histolytica HM-1:IMSS]EMD48269.1 Hypothetical protein EHI5A_002070 [Entamoeba histolytica KU27]EMH72456.1 hypothetical protein EHI8A_000430 [Entamoeba histolytica HM-1:IMSS-B]EMS15014.1 hypothetical protein KM1_001020 [Entamoeba histolytica HM-3:IMSS]ENY60686.1 hypothetical protein EHI7A_001090 [Entamoeba histolytica HM-1:IMSS-A]GAT93928.1 hypothetical protein CL6EHI_118740 [Entamoeba histolytica]|eukprot:XP_654123.1 hypothetical protein EHI_118740 [Entamoeba histolytica HM-1:IMSS]